MQLNDLEEGKLNNAGRGEWYFNMTYLSDTSKLDRINKHRPKNFSGISKYVKETTGFNQLRYTKEIANWKSDDEIANLRCLCTEIYKLRYLPTTERNKQIDNTTLRICTDILAHVWIGAVAKFVSSGPKARKVLKRVMFCLYDVKCVDILNKKWGYIKKNLMK